MFSLDQLELPVVGAPMAGGPSTPALAAAVTNAGGLGFLAAGSKAPDQVAAEVDQTRALTSGPFGVNIFVPDHANQSFASIDKSERAKQVAAYRERLETESPYAVALPDPDPSSDDGWDAKLALVARMEVPVVSFTFGLPSAAVIDALHGSNCCAVITVTDVDEAANAVANGADILCVQGPLAGGHRGTHTVDKEPGTQVLDLIVREITARFDTPVIAAGGITTSQEARAILAAGATAIQIGTMLVRCPESGASQTHRDALADPVFSRTTITRAFTGRPARGIRNDFVDRFDNHAPAAYPELNQLTKPLRAAATAAGDSQHANLWASPSFSQATDEPAADVIRRIAPPAT